MRPSDRGTSPIGARMLIVAVLLSLLACSITEAPTPAPPSTPTSGQASPTPSQSAAASPAQELPFVRIEPHEKRDVTIVRAHGYAPWVGPWPDDISGMSLTIDESWLVLELSFSRRGPRARDWAGPHWANEIFVNLDAPGEPRFVSQPAERGFYGTTSPHYMRFLVKPCEHKPQLEEGDFTLTIRARYECVDELERIRARAWFTSYHMFDDLPTGRQRWKGVDSTAYTAFARLGDSVAVKDPVR
jgi:hypothetical protein